MIHPLVPICGIVVATQYASLHVAVQMSGGVDHLRLHHVEVNRAHERERVGGRVSGSAGVNTTVPRGCRGAACQSKLQRGGHEVAYVLLSHSCLRDYRVHMGVSASSRLMVGLVAVCRSSCM